MSTQQIIQIEERFKQLKIAIKAKRADYEVAVKKVADKLPLVPNYKSSMATFIEQAQYNDECIFFIVYGALRFDKTAYACKTLAWLLQTWDWDFLKRFIVFKPIEFINVCKRPLIEDFKYPALVWDDAGVWLSALKWNDKLLKAIIDYFNVVGTHFSSVIFTSPLPTYVVKKLRGLPSCSNVQVMKVNNNPSKPRIARGYYQWMLPDMKKTGVKPYLNDRFSAIMPTAFFEPYQRYRKEYTSQAFKIVEENLYAEANTVLSTGKSELDKVKKSNEEIDISGIESDLDEDKIDE